MFRNGIISQDKNKKGANYTKKNDSFIKYSLIYFMNILKSYRHQILLVFVLSDSKIKNPVHIPILSQASTTIHIILFKFVLGMLTYLFDKIIGM